ncbi:MAG: hypothetical protein KDK65_01860 [Chlamydiia bacterium]|nr:hypothetical protein [Chlamydiia bacterium]
MSSNLAGNVLNCATYGFLTLNACQAAFKLLQPVHPKSIFGAKDFPTLEQELGTENYPQGLRKDIFVVQLIPNPKPIEIDHMGANCTKWGYPIIEMPAGLRETEPDAYRTLLLREAHKIRHNSRFLADALAVSVGLIALAVIGTRSHPFKKLLVTVSAMFLTNTLYNCFANRRAEDWAIQTTPPKNLKSYLLIVKVMQEVSKAQNGWFVDDCGDPRWNFTGYKLSTIENKVRIKLMMAGISAELTGDEQLNVQLYALSLMGADRYEIQKQIAQGLLK